MNPTRRYFVAICALIAVGCAAGCSTQQLPRRIGESLDAIPAAKTSAQFLYVDPASASTSQATVYAVQRSLLGWQLALPPVTANVGRNGIAPPWEKREGDGRTPSGLFPLRQAFGYPVRLDTKIPYRQVGNPDIWVDDVHSPDYNRWVWRGETAASSYEELFRFDPLYKYAVVAEYNTDPAVRDAGSAIFIHVERGAGAPTAGCVSLPEASLLDVMRWLDPGENPQIVIGNPSAVETVAAGVASELPSDLPPELGVRLQGAKKVFAVRRGGGTGFFAVAVSLPADVEKQMLEKKTWRAGCPVPPERLAYLVTSYWGFDGAPHYGELVVHSALSAFVVDSMHYAYSSRFPIERMELIENYDGDDFRSMAANNTSAFNCREVPEKPGVFSKHSYGAAIDINPRRNPYLLLKKEDPSAAALPGGAAAVQFCTSHPATCEVLPADAAGFLDRGDRRPGMLVSGDPVVTAFRQRGFVWGGEWRMPDYQHIQYDVKRLITE